MPVLNPLVPNHSARLLPRVARVCPSLSRPALRRIAEMAVAMREAALNAGACERAHLAAAGFTTSEIELGWRVAERALTGAAETAPAEMVPAFTVDDIVALRAFNRRAGLRVVEVA